MKLSTEVKDLGKNVGNTTELFTGENNIGKCKISSRRFNFDLFATKYRISFSRLLAESFARSFRL